MAGERLHPPGWTEISAVCTDPAFRGQGLASRLVLAVAAGIRARGETPFLHTAAAQHERDPALRVARLHASPHPDVPGRPRARHGTRRLTHPPPKETHHDLTSSRYASPVDTETYGAYRINRVPGDERPLYRFTGRVTADGSSGFRAEPGRYHIYAGWFCPWAQRTTIERALHGLEDVVSVSYVDDARDGRGWAFREHHGADPVNGFELLRDAYNATEPDFDGHVSVPTLWDRRDRAGRQQQLRDHRHRPGDRVRRVEQRRRHLSGGIA